MSSKAKAMSRMAAITKTRLWVLGSIKVDLTDKIDVEEDLAGF